MIAPLFHIPADGSLPEGLAARLDPAPELASTEVLDAVRTILRDVRQRGDAAVIDYTHQFDGVTLTPDTLRAPAEAIHPSAAKCPAELRQSLATMITHVRRFHEPQHQEGYRLDGPSGSTLRMMVRPVECAALYVPGGTAAYPTTVVMNAVPAQIAGVERIIVLTPPGALQSNPAVAAALSLLGLTEVYQVGGAQAIAAAAYGTATVPKADIIVGPGNTYVATAKREVFGLVGIDSVAGPSEVAILADETAPPALVAADLVAQAEHDPLARCILITTSTDLVAAVTAELHTQLAETPRRAIAEQALREHGALVTVSRWSDMITIANRFAAEHLQVMVSKDSPLKPESLVASAIFWGPSTPTALGDYWAGPNHVLPTGSASRYSGPLGVQHFMKHTSVLHYTPEAAAAAAKPAAAIADAEALHAHAAALRLRSGE
ncbi:MAG: histidinol dehydrogenase [Myxococcota bacterium]